MLKNKSNDRVGVHLAAPDPPSASPLLLYQGNRGKRNGAEQDRQPVKNQSSPNLFATTAKMN